MAAASAEMEREIQQLEARLQWLRDCQADLMACTAHECKERKAAVKADSPSDVVRANQHISVLHSQYLAAYVQRGRVSNQLADLRQQAQQ